MNEQEKYINMLNKILPKVDFQKLDKSCNSSDNSYAKDVLTQMHNAFTKVYDGGCIYEGELDFVMLPAVIRGRNTGHTALGIVSLDLESSGEHCGTIFLTPMGALEQGSETATYIQKEYIDKTFIPYDYWYTPEVEGDIHVDFENIPEQTEGILNACHHDRPNLTDDDLTEEEIQLEKQDQDESSDMKMDM